MFDKTVIQVDDLRHRQYAPIDLGTNRVLHRRLFQTRITRPTVLFLRELCANDGAFHTIPLVENGNRLTSALEGLGLLLQVIRHRDQNSVERIPR